MFSNTANQIRSLDMQVVVIGICGGSGAGKTFLADALAAELADACARISFDSYYHDLSAISPEERSRVNYDHPDSVEDALLATHLAQLKSGNEAHVPHYDFPTHTRPGGVDVVTPAPTVIVDGILLLASPPVRQQLDIAVYVEAPRDLRFERRLARDTTERGRTYESVQEQYLTTVDPMHHEFVGPAANHADLIVTGIGPMDAVVADICQMVRDRTGAA
jgi:uridine kinase